MKKLIMIFAVLLMTAGLFAYSKYRTMTTILNQPDETIDAATPVKKGTCTTLGDRSIFERLEFQGETVRISSEMFFTPECQGEGWYAWTSVATYKPTGGLKADFSSGLLETSFGETFLSPLSKEAEESANANAWCGKQGWTVGVEVKVPKGECPNHPQALPTVINLEQFKSLE